MRTPLLSKSCYSCVVKQTSLESKVQHVALKDPDSCARWPAERYTPKLEMLLRSLVAQSERSSPDLRVKCLNGGRAPPRFLAQPSQEEVETFQ